MWEHNIRVPPRPGVFPDGEGGVVRLGEGGVVRLGEEGVKRGIDVRS